MLSLRSELRRKVLTFFLMNREARVYVRQLAVALNGRWPTHVLHTPSLHDGPCPIQNAFFAF
ncbi:MAG: hypothetical protein P4K83_02590 [Terracidiphilus sp.]|nr:hypothetical protein [Terracidiphilus sp.]